MRKVLIYFQDDRARRHQQKGRPPCGHPRTTRTIRKGQRGRLPRARRGSRGQSRSYVVGRAQVRLAFSHLALPLPLFLSRFLQSCCIILTVLFSLCPPPLLLDFPRLARKRTRKSHTHLPPLPPRNWPSKRAALCHAIFCTYVHRTRSNCNAQGRKEEQVIEGWFASKPQPFCRGWDVVVCCLVLVCGIDKLWVEWKNSRLFVPRYARGRILLREDRWNRGISRAKGLVARNVWHSIFDETLPSLWNWYSEIRSSFFLSFVLSCLVGAIHLARV